MRLFAPPLASVILSFACGGSASETPFPAEPLPDYVTHKAAATNSANKPGTAADTAKGAPSVEPSPATPKAATPSATEPKKATTPAF